MSKMVMLMRVRTRTNVAEPCMIIESDLAPMLRVFAKAGRDAALAMSGFVLVMRGAQNKEMWHKMRLLLP